ncbi:MAG: amidohydrolase family protein, partial [Bryobacteraceae bacterium]
MRCLCSVLLAAFAPVLSAETRIFENFTLMDGTGRAPVPNAALVVVDGRITFAGPRAKLRAPAGAERVDLTGKFVMPGLINAHGHLGNVAGLVQDPRNYT